MEVSHREEKHNEKQTCNRKYEKEKLFNISEFIEKNISQESDKPFLGIKIGNTFKWQTYTKVREVIGKLKNYFKNEDNSELFTTIRFQNKEFRMIGIFTNPRPENLIFMLTFHLLRITVLPIFNTIQHSTLKKIVIHSEVETLIVDFDYLALLINKNVLEKREDKSYGTKIKNIILIDSGENGISEVYENGNLEEKFDTKKAKLQLSQIGIKLILLSEILNNNEENVIQNNFDDCTCKFVEDDPEDIILLNYNGSKSEFFENEQVISSEISSLKGILISERSFMTTLNSLLEHRNYNMNLEDTYYSFNSTADIPEYLHNLVSLSKGIKIGYFSGRPTEIFDDLKTLQPSILYLYPRVLNKISEALYCIIDKLDENKKKMVTNAIKIKVNCLLDHGRVDHHIWDKLLFQKIKDALGGNIRLIIVGGGHLRLDVLNFLKVCLNTDITEIYGVTESCGVISISEYDSNGNKYIGNSINCVEISIKPNQKLSLFQADYANNNYYPKKCGEICIKGSLFSGYYKAKTLNEVIDTNGYFNTGDYGIIYEDLITDNEIKNQHLRFIDKSDEILITPMGFLISPNLLEEIYSKSDYVSSASIIQDKEMNLIAILELNKNKILSIQLEKQNSNQLEDLSLIQRKGSMNSNLTDNTGASLEFKKDKSRIKYSKSIYVKNNKPKFLSENHDNLNIPITSNSRSPQYVEKTSKRENPVENENEKLKKEILKSFTKIFEENKLKKYEAINKVFILQKNLIPSIENGLLTSKMRLNRKNLRLAFQNGSNNY